MGNDVFNDMHPALVEVVALMHGTNVEVLDPAWVDFDTADAFVSANIKEGGPTVRLRAVLLDGELNSEPTTHEVTTWIAEQPPVVGGVLEQARFEGEGVELHRPRLVFESGTDEVSTTSVGWTSRAEEIVNFARAWQQRTVAEGSPQDGTSARQRYWERSLQIGPRNAWLLIGDGASWPTEAELETARRENLVGIHNILWTAPKTIEVGDLVLIYFVAPTKAACFVAGTAEGSVVT